MIDMIQNIDQGGGGVWKGSLARDSCSDLAKLNGGTANFLYRGTLLQPLDPQDAAPDSTTETVVIKHSEGFSPRNRDFLLDITRCVMTDLMSPRHLKMCSDLSSILPEL